MAPVPLVRDAVPRHGAAVPKAPKGGGVGYGGPAAAQAGRGVRSLAALSRSGSGTIRARALSLGAVAAGVCNGAGQQEGSATTQDRGATAGARQELPYLGRPYRDLGTVGLAPSAPPPRRLPMTDEPV